MKKIFPFFLLIGFVIFASYRFKKTETNVGTVIVLNGPSVAGKSSLQKAFQKKMLPTLWVKVGIDNLFDKPMPDVELSELERWQHPNDIRWVTMGQDKDNNQVVTLFTGKEGEKVAYAMNSAIVAYAQNGLNVIVDYIAYKKEWLTDLQNKLQNIPHYFVAVKIPLSELEAREKNRATSPVGHARSHYASVYGDISYDFELQSDKHSAEELAQQLQNFLEAK